MKTCCVCGMGIRTLLFGEEKVGGITYISCYSCSQSLFDKFIQEKRIQEACDESARHSEESGKNHGTKRKDNRVPRI